jgi:hypothetical protein
MRRLIAAGVDGIMTDFPERLAGIIEEKRDGRQKAKKREVTVVFDSSTAAEAAWHLIPDTL